MRKGVTLLEVIIAVCIGSIVILMEISLFLNSIKNYKESVVKDREGVYSKEALRFIESEIVDVKNKTIGVDKDKLILRKFSGDKHTIKAVKSSKGKSKIVIEYDKITSTINTTDTILEGIKDFKVKGDENLVYILIYTTNGEVYQRCLGSRKIEKVI